MFCCGHALRAATVRRTAYAAAPVASTTEPDITDETGRANARTRQPAGPTTGVIRGGRPSSGASVQAEAQAHGQATALNSGSSA